MAYVSTGTSNEFRIQTPPNLFPSLMYRLINDNSDAVVEQLGKLDVPSYVRLRKDLLIGADETSGPDFQRRYRAYWRMNVARLGEPFHEGYFKLLSRCRSTGQADISAVAQCLADLGRNGRKSLQFSFATKLVHMVNPREPVYDSFVAAFYFYSPPATAVPFDDRLGDLMAFHTFLKNEYRRVINQGLLSTAIGTLRERLAVGEDVCDERVIDWLVWGWVGLLRSRAQQDDRALYR